MRTVAKVLEDACPQSGFVARIGGDEFIFMLPFTRQEISLALIEQIKRTLSNHENLPFTVSVALGTASKRSAEESIDDVIALADKRMYKDKRQMKECFGDQDLF